MVGGGDGVSFRLSVLSVSKIPTFPERVTVTGVVHSVASASDDVPEVLRVSRGTGMAERSDAESEEEASANGQVRASRSGQLDAAMRG